MASRVILIFGDPDSGKSHLAADICEGTDYDAIHIDEVYLDFIKEKYPDLYLNSLALVVSQHYAMILKATEKGVEKVWRDHVISVIKERLAQSPRLVVEGYLLQPILKSVRSRLSREGTTVTVIYARDRQYYSSEGMAEWGHKQ